MRGYLGFALVGLLIAGCGGKDSGSDNGSAPWYDGARPAAASAKVGGSDTACPLPVAIDIPDKWKPAGLDAGMFGQGGLDARCEIDAKPAGAVGFIRVWVGSSAEPRQALESYLADQPRATDIQYRDTAVGQGSGVEATWVNENTGRQRAFAMSTPLKAIMVSAGGIDDEEHQKMLPAYLLAKQSLTPLER